MKAKTKYFFSDASNEFQWIIEGIVKKASHVVVYYRRGDIFFGKSDTGLKIRFKSNCMKIGDIIKLHYK